MEPSQMHFFGGRKRSGEEMCIVITNLVGEYAKCFITGCSCDLSYRCMREDADHTPIYLNWRSRQTSDLLEKCCYLTLVTSDTFDIFTYIDARHRKSHEHPGLSNKTFCMRFPKFRLLLQNISLFLLFFSSKNSHGFAERSKILARPNKILYRSEK